ncbi:Hpt domain-containing protein, partial [Caulobacter segnis]
MSGQDPVEIFRQEAQELFEEIEQGLLDLAHRPGDRDLVDAVFRGLHTLKGSGAMFGFDALAAFTHHCETAFDRVRKGEVAATSELVGAVLACQDHMRALAEGRPAEEAEGEALLAELHRCGRQRRRLHRRGVRHDRRPGLAARRARPQDLAREVQPAGRRPGQRHASIAAAGRAARAGRLHGRRRHRQRPGLRRPGSDRVPPGLGRDPGHQARPRRDRGRLHLRDRRHDPGHPGH